MNKNKNLILLKVNEKCFLRPLTKEDVSDNYISWLNDYEVMKFTEQKYHKHSKGDVEKFVNQKFESKSDFLFGIFYENKHIGNIKLGPILWEHRSAVITYFIGEKSYWGNGIATIVVEKVVNFGITDLSLEKIHAGYYSNNYASGKVLANCGFKLEGERTKSLIFEGKRVNYVLVGYFKDDYH